MGSVASEHHYHVVFWRVQRSHVTSSSERVEPKRDPTVCILILAPSVCELTRNSTTCRCCACPETKAARDDCFLKFGHNVEEHGESARKCEELVKRHRECMASLGFKI